MREGEGRREGRFTVNRPRLMVPTNLETEMVERSIIAGEGGDFLFSFFFG